MIHDHGLACIGLCGLAVGTTMVIGIDQLLAQRFSSDRYMLMERSQRIGRRDLMPTPTEQGRGMTLSEHKTIGLGTQLGEFDAIGIG